MIKAHQTVLVVEDSDDDYEALTRALRTDGIVPPSLYRCEDGQQALDYLSGLGTSQNPSDPVRPALVLLDLNMPGINGYTVLARMKAETSLKSIPVIIMTTSDDERDIEACYRMGANAYVMKPAGSSDLHRAVQQLTAFWFDFAMLPASKSGSVTLPG